MKDKLKSALEPIALLGTMLLLGGALLFVQASKASRNIDKQSCCYKAKQKDKCGK